MYAARTTYRLATSPTDYKACHAFFRAEARHPKAEAEDLATDYKTEKIGSPTVYALRDENVIGVMATRIVPQFGIVACPYHISYDITNHMLVAMHLADCYEFFLRQAGIPSYTVVLPNYKRGSIRLFTELHTSQLVKRVLDDRFDVLLVQVP